MTSRIVDVLANDECYTLLSGGGVGRLAYVDEVGPAALPVNYAVVGKDIVFRIEATSVLRHAIGQQVAFEVDQIHPVDNSGWSVLLRGHACEVPLEQVPRLLRDAGPGFPKPWAAGVHNVWVRVEVQAVSGRRLSGPFSELVF